jgi:hypothetical protein
MVWMASTLPSPSLALSPCRSVSPPRQAAFRTSGERNRLFPPLPLAARVAFPCSSLALRPRSHLLFRAVRLFFLF